MDSHRDPTPPRPLAILSTAVLACALLAGPRAFAQDPPAAPPAPPEPAAAGFARESDGPSYPISEITVRYLRDNELHPPIENAMQVEVTLGQTSTGFVAPRDDVPPITFALGDIADRPLEVYHASAIQRLLEVLRDYFVEQDLLGVYVAPDPQQISPNGDDLRLQGNTGFTIMVTTGVVTEMRTVGSGERVGEGFGRDMAPADRINNPLHASVMTRSPLQPYADADEKRNDLLRKDELDRYLFHLGRHPGRRVDAAVSASEDIGGIALDYMITENRPLVIYAQLSNTGTPSTDRLRERVGILHTQLTNYDDILSLDYTTSSFDEVNAVVASYERPFSLENDRFRWRVYGNWSQYTASEVGFFFDIFRGTSWATGGEVAWNFYQNKEMFLDLVGGVRYDDIEVRERFLSIEGDADFLTPYIGLRLDRTAEWFSTRGFANLEGNVNDPSESELVRLGRTDPSRHWMLFRFDLAHSFFLEPVLNRKAWEDPSTPESSTLAHEVALNLRGQYAFDDRLVPQLEQVVGGLYTVRGYPESVIAGDSVVILNSEYRFHFPRALPIEPEPGALFGKAFRTAPQYVYGRPDWDLVLKAFLDVASVNYSDATFFEEDETLMGAGVGLDLAYRRNFNVRVDWGFVLKALDSRDVNSGSNRVSFVATFLF